MSSVTSATATHNVQQLFNSIVAKKPTEAVGTRNNDGTYGSRHTVKAPSAADTAQEFAVAQAILSIQV